MFLRRDLRGARAAAGRRGARLSLAVLFITVAAADRGGADTRDPAPVLARHHAPLARVERRAAPELGARVERWRLITVRGDTVFALWRRAPAAVERPWTAVMMGGLHTGNRAAVLLPEDSPFHALAVDWPWRGPRTLSLAGFLMRLPAIERAALFSPSALALGVEAAARTPGVDASRVVLVGVSLGAPPALAALRLTVIPDAVVLVDAGADLEMLVRVGLEREGWLHGPASVTAAGAYWRVWPLEPRLNAPAAARLPVLVVNSEGDEHVPRASATLLHASLPHATVRWRRGPHVRAGQSDVIARLTRDVDAWLRAREPARVPARRGTKPATR